MLYLSLNIHLIADIIGFGELRRPSARDGWRGDFRQRTGLIVNFNGG